MAVTTTAGGLASVAGGGKFGNGAITAAFGYLYNDYYHSEQEQAARYEEPSIPQAPSGVDIDANINEPEKHMNPYWLYEQVKTTEPWDFKYGGGSSYEDYGNFHYGAVAAANGFGFSEFKIYNEAGINQYYGGNQGPAEWGQPSSRSAYITGYSTGKYPYGDDPWDRYWIRRGIAYYNNSKSKAP